MTTARHVLFVVLMLLGMTGFLLAIRSASGTQPNLPPVHNLLLWR
jgi:hypothetical protein